MPAVFVFFVVPGQLLSQTVSTVLLARELGVLSASAERQGESLRSTVPAERRQMRDEMRLLWSGTYPMVGRVWFMVDLALG